jgi:hypothetical protein
MQQPFVVVVRTQNGEFVGATVNLPPGNLDFPPFPPLPQDLQAAPPNSPSPPAVVVPPPPVIVQPPLVIVGTNVITNTNELEKTSGP